MANWLWHKHNIEIKTKDDASNSYRSIKDDFLKFFNEKYIPFHNSQNEISTTTDRSINKKGQLFDEYLHSADKFVEQMKTQRRKVITAQCKFRSSIIEEFCGYLFKDLQEIEELDLGFFHKKVFAGLNIDEEGNLKIKTKDVDFCIGKEFEINVSDSKTKIIVPIVAIECKTYIDKTMFGEAQFTAQKIKQGTPNSRVYVLAEENQIGADEVPSVSQTPLDQVFILRDKRNGENKSINLEVLRDFFNQVQSDVRSIAKEVEENWHKKAGRLLSN